MDNRPLSLVYRRMSLRAVSIAILAAFALSNSSSIDHESAPARKSAANTATPVLAVSPLPDMQPDVEEDSVDDSTTASQDDKPSVLPPDVRKPAESEIPALPAVSETSEIDEVDEYLWNVYQRSNTKLDSHGDFTWKDVAAAARLGLSLEEYVIGGMDRDFRELLFRLGQAMDAAGIDWTILSAFRDDYRQSLAVGFKAQVSNSFHGGSAATGGYGHGCAVDLSASDGVESSNALWKWLDQHGEQFGLHRPLRRVDPAHVQPFGAWHHIAATLRNERIASGHEQTASNMTGPEFGEPIPPVTADHSPGITEEQYMCARPQMAGDSNKVGRILSHLKPVVASAPISSADRRHPKVRLRMIGNLRNPQHAAADNVKRHARSKARLHLVDQTNCACDPLS